MTNASPHEEAQLLARLTVLEHVVALMVRDSMIMSGQSAGDILAFGEKVKCSSCGATGDPSAGDRACRRGSWASVTAKP